MTWITILVFVLVFAFGLLGGVVAVVWWWQRAMRQPGFAEAQLEWWWARAHPHWCQISEEDTRRACPCCGWSEERGARAKDRVTKTIEDLRHGRKETP